MEKLKSSNQPRVSPSLPFLIRQDIVHTCQEKTKAARRQPDTRFQGTQEVDQTGKCSAGAINTRVLRNVKKNEHDRKKEYINTKRAQETRHNTADMSILLRDDEERAQRLQEGMLFGKASQQNLSKGYQLGKSPRLSEYYAV